MMTIFILMITTMMMVMMTSVFADYRDLVVIINIMVMLMKYRIRPNAVQVRHAEASGASAVLLYPDPSDVIDDELEPRDAYPRTHSLPGWSTQRGSLWRFGDPLTPGTPSIGLLLIYKCHMQFPLKID